MGQKRSKPSASYLDDGVSSVLQQVSDDVRLPSCASFACQHQWHYPTAVWLFHVALTTDRQLDAFQVGRFIEAVVQSVRVIGV